LSSAALGRALLPLRAFLGFTFCFAGLQKLANPGFFQAGNPGSIQAQLAGAARRSPIHPLIAPMVHVAVPLGLLIAVAELAIGLGTLLGLRQRLAAAGGVALSLMLFLTVSFHSSPYYTGADIVFAFAWTPLLLAGAGPLLSADALIAARARRDTRKLDAEQASRREVVLKGTVTAVAAAGGLVLGGAVAGLGRLAGGVRANPGAALSSPARPASSPAAAPSATGTAGSHPAGTAIGPVKNFPVGGAASFTDPRSGDPSIVIRASAGKFVAFDAVCPHAGCTVQYDQSAALIVCPCHGSQFNAATGAVETGPAATGLNPITIAQGGDGQLYVSGLTLAVRPGRREAWISRPARGPPRPRRFRTKVPPRVRTFAAALRPALPGTMEVLTRGWRHGPGPGTAVPSGPLAFPPPARPASRVTSGAQALAAALAAVPQVRAVQRGPVARQSASQAAIRRLSSAHRASTPVMASTIARTTTLSVSASRSWLATCQSVSGGSVSWPSWVVHTFTVAPAGVPSGWGISPATPRPSGAVHRAGVR
jgi:thiosulfate dehydrogenase [quinone] large subunit